MLGRVVDTAKNLVLRESQVEHLACARVLPVARPHRTKPTADSLPTVEGDEVVQVLRGLRQMFVAGCAQGDLDSGPPSSTVCAAESSVFSAETRT